MAEEGGRRSLAEMGIPLDSNLLYPFVLRTQKLLIEVENQMKSSFGDAGYPDQPDFITLTTWAERFKRAATKYYNAVDTVKRSIGPEFVFSCTHIGCDSVATLQAMRNLSLVVSQAFLASSESLTVLLMIHDDCVNKIVELPSPSPMVVHVPVPRL
jgi:hypothetical protein